MSMFSRAIISRLQCMMMDIHDLEISEIGITALWMRSADAYNIQLHNCQFQPGHDAP